MQYPETSKVSGVASICDIGGGANSDGAAAEGASNDATEAGGSGSASGAHAHCCAVGPAAGTAAAPGLGASPEVVVAGVVCEAGAYSFLAGSVAGTGCACSWSFLTLFSSCSRLVGRPRLRPPVISQLSPSTPTRSTKALSL